MEDEEITIQPEINRSNPSSEKPEMEDEAQTNGILKTSKSVVKKSSSQKTKLSVKSKNSSKSKLSSKSRSVVNSQSNKVLLTKSLDSVKALIASKESSTGNLKAVESIKKINKATSIGTLVKNKKIKSKKSKKHQEKLMDNFPKLDTSTVRKVARELIRKKGCSLLNVHPIKMLKRKHYKKKLKN